MSFEERDILLLMEILEMIESIEKYTAGLTEDEFYNMDVVKDAVLLKLIMIGELVNKLSDGLKSAESHVSWNQIKAARNFYVHQYGHVDWTTVWEVKYKHLSLLKNQIKTILEK